MDKLSFASNFAFAGNFATGAYSRFMKLTRISVAKERSSSVKVDNRLVIHVLCPTRLPTFERKLLALIAIADRSFDRPFDR